MKTPPASYAHALTLMGARANAPTKRLNGRSTVAYRLPDGSIAVRYHSTDILTFSPTGRVTLNTGGFKSVTTKAKINEYLPASFPRVWQGDSLWTIAGQPFLEGDTLTPRGNCFAVRVAAQRPRA